MIALKFFKTSVLLPELSFTIIVMVLLKELQRFILQTKMMPFEQLMNMMRLRSTVVLCM